jgi:hypothetical protein
MAPGPPRFALWKRRHARPRTRLAARGRSRRGGAALLDAGELPLSPPGAVPAADRRGAGPPHGLHGRATRRAGQRQGGAAPPRQELPRCLLGAHRRGPRRRWLPRDRARPDRLRALLQGGHPLQLRAARAVHPEAPGDGGGREGDGGGPLHGRHAGGALRAPAPRGDGAARPGEPHRPRRLPGEGAVHERGRDLPGHAHPHARGARSLLPQLLRHLARRLRHLGGRGLAPDARRGVAPGGPVLGPHLRHDLHAAGGAPSPTT